MSIEYYLLLFFVFFCPPIANDCGEKPFSRRGEESAWVHRDRVTVCACFPDVQTQKSTKRFE